MAKTHQIQIFGEKTIEVIKCTKSSLVPASTFSKFILGATKKLFPTQDFEANLM